MENKAHALAAGAFVLGVIAMIVALVVWFTRDDTVRDVYELSTSSPVTGLRPQAPVRYRGVAVGKVQSIDFDPKKNGNVRVLIAVDRQVPLTESSFAKLAYQGVTGLAFVSLDDSGQSTVALKPDAKNPPKIPLRSSMFAELQDRGEAILGQAQSVGDKVNELLSDANQKRIADALENIAKAAASANQLTTRLERSMATGVDPTLAKLPPLAENTRETLASLKKAAGDVSRAANNFNTTVAKLNEKDGALAKLGDSAQSLSRAVESINSATLPRVNRVAEDADRAVRRLGRAANTLTDNPQSLIYGTGKPAAGPGEEGFRAPAENR